MKYLSSLIRPRSNRTFAAYLCWISGLLLTFMVINYWPDKVSAQTTNNAVKPHINFTTQVLYNGDFKYGNWLPIAVNLQNQSGIANVQIEASVSTSYGNIKNTTTFRRSVQLSDFSQKKVLLYVQPVDPETETTGLTINYPLQIRVTANGQVISSSTVLLKPIGPSDYLVGTVGVSQAAANQLNDMHVGPAQSRVTTTTLNPEDLPDRAEGLGSFNALIFSNINTSSLNSQQMTALKNWINQGGSLILMGGSGWSKVKAGFGPDLLPFQVYDYSNVTNLDGVTQMLGDSTTDALGQAVVIAKADVLQGASALASETWDDEPPTTLIAQRTMGLGHIFATAADFTVTPLTNWLETSRVWQNLFNYSAPYLNTTANSPYRERTVSSVSSLISDIPNVQLPDLTIFIALALIYVAVVGPISFLVLRHFKRSNLAWVSLPLSALIFLGVLYLFYISRFPESQTMVNQISVIKADASNHTANLQSYAAILSDQNKNYSIAANLPDGSDFSLFQPMPLPSYYNAHSSSNLVEENSDTASLDNFQVGQWNVQGFSMQTNLSNVNYNLQANLHFQNNVIVGTIRNDTGQSLHNVMLAMGQNIVRLPDLVPSQTINVKFPLSSPTSASMAYCGSSFASYSAYSTSPSLDRITSLWNETSASDKLLQTRLDFVKRLFQNGDIGPLNPHLGLHLIGWLDQNPSPVLLDNKAVQTYSQQLLIENLAVSASANASTSQVSIPAGYLMPDSITNELGLAAFTSRLDQQNQVCVSSGKVTVEYHLTADGGTFKPQQLQFYLNSFTADSDRNPQKPDVIEMYDWQKQGWVQMNNLINSAMNIGSDVTVILPPPKVNDISDPTRYINPQTGVLLVRFTAKSALQVEFNVAAQGTR